MKRINYHRKLQREYNKLKKIVNPILAKPFLGSEKQIQFGGTRGKSNELLREQIRTMKRIIKDETKYGELARAHNYKLNFYHTIKDTGDTNTANRIRAMSSARFKEFYDWLVKNGYDSDVLDFNDFYPQDSGDEWITSATLKTLNDYLDEFYGIKD